MILISELFENFLNIYDILIASMVFFAGIARVSLFVYF
jgi:hypothetical protein